MSKDKGPPHGAVASAAFAQRLEDSARAFRASLLEKAEQLRLAARDGGQINARVMELAAELERLAQERE